jgi:predicted nucleic acid-binding protein
VVVSALRSRQGASNELLRLALIREFELVLSEPLFLEYESVLKRPEQLLLTKLSMEEVDELLERLADNGLKIDLGAFRRPTLRDAGDEHVMNLAWRARVDALVTFNLRDFQPAASVLRVHCCLPGDALRLLETGYA